MKAEKLIVNTLRALAVDQIEEAKSGHPGIALGAAPIMYAIYKALKYSPREGSYFNRDRFVLSAGHGSALLYSALHLFTDGVTLDELKKFRKLDSKTPGHPENFITPFVDASTGPLGQGVAMAVGMAIAQQKLAEKFNRENYSICDHYTYCLVGDGCLMEGMSIEALDLAAALNLNKLIVLFDSNQITIEGSTKMVRTEDLVREYAAKGFNVLRVKKGNREEVIYKAILKAKRSLRPSLIIVDTVIGYGSEKAGDCSVHGAPLGEELAAKLKETLGVAQEKFFVPEALSLYLENFKNQKQEQIDSEQKQLELYKNQNPETFETLQKFLVNDFTFKADLKNLDAKDMATRQSGNIALNQMAMQVHNLIGGGADVAMSTKAVIKDGGNYAPHNMGGRNIYFGVREHAMAGICNGIALHGGFRTFCTTFFAFADYMKGAMRMSALMSLPVLYIMATDSIGAGEDGPTHQPVEQLAMLRATPNTYVFRPCDITETLAAYETAYNLKAPSVLVLSRQAMPKADLSDFAKAQKGAYVLVQEDVKKPLEAILIASGSEVHLAVAAVKESKRNVRIVSMLCDRLFDEQNEKYKQTILPSACENRVIIEAGSEMGLAKYKGLKGTSVCMNIFGKSAKGEVLFEHFGFTVQNINEKIEAFFKPEKPEKKIKTEELEENKQKEKTETLKITEEN